MLPPGAESVVVKADGGLASVPRIAGKFSINDGGNSISEGFFFARSNVNIFVVSFIIFWLSALAD